MKNKILILDKCPMCEQQVDHNHKNTINERESVIIKSIEDEINNLKNLESLLEKELNKLKKDLEYFNLKEKEHSIILIKKEDLNSRLMIKEKFNEEILEIEKELKCLNDHKIILEKNISDFSNIEQFYNIEKKALDFLQNNQKILEVDKARLDMDLENNNKIIEELISEIELKEKKKLKLTYYIELQDWLEEFFNPLMLTIERKVMLKLHSDFNSLFQKWFFTIMNTEIIKVRLDEEFTPIIEQNGFDTEYGNLSGGEKTACALAYRLSLNQVINFLLSTINTNDLIILDEPTDGFSSEQLDRIRSVLEELNIKQIIIVSHENKIETFADNIIKIKKENHISKII